MLPYFIERMLNLRYSTGGGPLVELASIQNIPAGGIAAGATVRTVRTPRQGVYAYIVFRTLIGPGVPPNIFNLSIEHVGYPVYNAVIGTAIIAEGLFLSMVVTDTNPINETIISAGVIATYWEQTYDYLEVRSKEDLEALMTKVEVP